MIAGSLPMKFGIATIIHWCLLSCSASGPYFGYEKSTSEEMLLTMKIFVRLYLQVTQYRINIGVDTD